MEKSRTVVEFPSLVSPWRTQAGLSLFPAPFRRDGVRGSVLGWMIGHPPSIASLDLAFSESHALWHHLPTPRRGDRNNIHEKVRWIQMGDQMLIHWSSCWRRISSWSFCCMPLSRVHSQSVQCRVLWVRSVGHLCLCRTAGAFPLNPWWLSSLTSQKSSPSPPVCTLPSLGWGSYLVGWVWKLLWQTFLPTESSGWNAVFGHHCHWVPRHQVCG